jgi:hypothetical protein
MPDGSEIEGRVEGAGEDGSLALRTQSGPRRFYGGELSLRPV